MTEETITTPVKADAYVKNQWQVPMSDGETYTVRAGWAVDRVTDHDIRSCAEIEYSRMKGTPIGAAGNPELVARS